MSRRKMRQKRLDRRKPRLESLESRRLLTVAADVFYYEPANEFTVRRNAADAIDLRAQIPYQHSPGNFAPYASANYVPVSVIEGAEGTISFDAEGRDIQYQPAEDFFGVDVFTIGFVDSTALPADGDEASIVEVRMAVNVIDPWYAVDDWFQVDAGATESTQLDVLKNDILQHYTRHSGNHLTVIPSLSLQSVQSEGSGSVEINNGMLAYTPATNFTGVETIQYTARSSNGDTVEGTTQVRVSSESPDSMWPEQLQQALLELAVQQNRYQFSQSAAHDYGYDPYYADDGLRPVEIAELALTRAVDFSGTNNQLSDVDESDRIKSDGEFLYVLSKQDANDWFGWDFFGRIAQSNANGAESENVLTVVDIRQPDTPMIVTRHILTDKVQSLDLHGNRLSVIASREANTVVTTLDVTDPTNVATVATTVVDGYFKQARRVGDTLYVFTNEHGNRAPKTEAVEIEDGAFQFYESASQYVNRVSDQLVATAMPSYDVYDSDGNVTQSDVLATDQLELGELHERRLNIITIDTASETGGVLDWDVNFGGDTVLVTASSIYVTDTQHNGGITPLLDDTFVLDWMPETPTIVTEIDRYELADDGTVAQSAKGSVPGTLKNSFSLDEHDGSLRIATENPWWSTSEAFAGSSLYVLQQTGDELKTIGGVTGLAPGEQIYAVRFAGDRGYVVTFRQVDPLFVVDLSDPTDPKLEGELKVPGYSQYLHVISEDHVLGVGRDADETTGLYEGLTVSLFNVSDPANPTLQDRYLFEGGRSTFSPFAGAGPWSLEDHHAISYFSDSGVLALPFFSKRYGSENPIFQSSSESAVRTFRIDPVDGISVLDTIPFESRADRTIRVGEHLLSLSPEQLKVTNLLQPDGVIATLDFEREGADDFVEIPDGADILMDVLDNDGIDGSTLEILAASLVEGAGEIEIVDDQKIRFTPEPGMLKPHRVRYTARDAAGTLIDAIATIDPDLEWQNLQNRLDVNADGKISPVDAIIGINTIAEFGFPSVEDLEAVLSDQQANGTFEHFFVDTNGDGNCSPADVIRIINFWADSTEDGGANTGFELDQPFDLAVGDVAKLNDDGGLTLTVSDMLENSLCPTDTDCIWAGQVRVKIDVTLEGDTQTHELVYQASQDNQIDVGGYSIELVGASPAPQLGLVPELEDYLFSVLISQLA